MPLVRPTPVRSAVSQPAQRRSPWLLSRSLGLVGLVLLLAALDPAGTTTSRAHATSADGRLEITSPVNASVVGDGDLVLVEGTAVDPVDGVVDGIEVALDEDDSWTPAARDADDATRWRYLWADPPPGAHRIRIRATGIEGAGVLEESVTVSIADVWSSVYTLDNPYAGSGSFRKGQLQVHSTNSFDGWNSLPPADLAREYRQRGYQFITITDHDVVSDPDEVDTRSFITIPGYESTSESGHIIGAFLDRVVAPNQPPQQRIDFITRAGGVAVLAHPAYQIGWRVADAANLRGYTAIEVFNGITDRGASVASNLRLWTDALNVHGWTDRIWAVAVDDAHEARTNPNSLDLGWVMVKTPTLDERAIRQALERGAFYASNGPRFEVLGVLGGAITASSPDAATIRFIDQDMRVLGQGPASGASYRPTGAERWIRVEAVMADGRTAWSQPFWLLPNAPHAAVSATSSGLVLSGQTLPGATVHVSADGQYLGFVAADGVGSFTYATGLDAEAHDFWVMAAAPWPDHLESLPSLLATGGAAPTG